jgi:hypothetical protein
VITLFSQHKLSVSTKYSSNIYCTCFTNFFLSFFFTEVRGAASNYAYYGYPELWILRYPAQRCLAVPSPGFEPTTLWLRVRRPNYSAMTLH